MAEPSNVSRGYDYRSMVVSIFNGEGAEFFNELSVGGGSIVGGATPHLVQGESGHLDGRDDSEVVGAAFEGIEEIAVLRAVGLDDVT